MRRKFSASILLLLVVFTIILPNHHFITRIKVSLTLTELDISHSECEKKLAVNLEVHSTLSSLIPTTIARKPHFHLPLINDKKIINSTLNFLYLATSPPTLS
jgi:hypothetical protein